MEVRYHGIDQLDISFQGALDYDVRERFRAAKARAVAQSAPEFIEINGIKGEVRGNGSASGYTFIFDTGPDGETWQFRDRGSVDEHNIFVSVRSAQLAARGYEGMKAALWERLSALGAKVITESINRIDYAVDVEAPAFMPAPEKVSCHARTGIAEFPDTSPIPKAGEQDVPVQRWRGRRIETITIGAMPGRQVSVYNKRNEVLNHPDKGHWLQIWGEQRQDCPVIWRCELRAPKDHLMDWRIRTFEDFEERGGDMFLKMMGAIRLLERCPETDENITRVPNDPIWDLVYEVVETAMTEHVSGATQGRIVEGRREDIDDRYCSQIFGMLTALAVVRRVPLEKMVDRLPAELAGDVEAFLVNRWRDFKRKYERAEDRLHFLGEGDESTSGVGAGTVGY